MKYCVQTLDPRLSPPSFTNSASRIKNIFDRPNHFGIFPALFGGYQTEHITKRTPYCATFTFSLTANIDTAP